MLGHVGSEAVRRVTEHSAVRRKSDWTIRTRNVSCAVSSTSRTHNWTQSTRPDLMLHHPNFKQILLNWD